MSFIRNLREKYMMRKNPVKYLRQLGADIGNGCEIYPSANFMEPYLIRLGDYVRVNEGVQFVTHDGGVWVLRHIDKDLKNIDLFGKICVGNNVHIGTNAVILPGVCIGNNCIIGVGSVVTKDVPDGSVVVGIPGRVIETIDEYAKKNKEQFVNTKQLSSKEKKDFLLQHINS